MTRMSGALPLPQRPASSWGCRLSRLEHGTHATNAKHGC